MTSKPLRILVSGDVNGRFDQLFSRITSIQQKSGSFDLLLCVGNFFGDKTEEWHKYSSGSVKVPLPVLILGPNKGEHVHWYKDMQGGDLCENVTYLGKKGLYNGSSGLQLAYLSGTQSDFISDNTSFNALDINSLTDPVKNDSKFKGVDILITSQWPEGVEKYSTELEGFSSSDCGSEALNELAIRLRPRYHFCGLEGVHYERQPYRNHKVLAEPARHVTRFIALANVGNENRKKYLYAFSMMPMSQMDAAELVSQPLDVTECPYKENSSVSVQAERQDQYFYDVKDDSGGKKRRAEGGADKQQKKHKPVPTGPCWFCLGSPEVEKHLVVSVGSETYLALAKGALVDEHILILPIGHYQSTVTVPEEVLEEIERYKKAIKKYLKKQGKAVVFFERNYKTQHLQIQAVPIPQDSVQDIKDMFFECAESESIELNEIPVHSDIRQIVQIGVPYFYAEVPTGEKLYCRISGSPKFPLQFGREVL
ncbi:CWF19-like protein 1 isoform X2 [Mercenaria mercenaria]|nr:CWF19-like protein 1 isoform X2 [Mercenaria mercenaria]